jgi:hypothetical protein
MSFEARYNAKQDRFAGRVDIVPSSFTVACAALLASRFPPTTPQGKQYGIITASFHVPTKGTTLVPLAREYSIATRCK